MFAGSERAGKSGAPRARFRAWDVPACQTSNFASQDTFAWAIWPFRNVVFSGCGTCRRQSNAWPQRCPSPRQLVFPRWLTEPGGGGGGQTTWRRFGDPPCHTIARHRDTMRSVLILARTEVETQPNNRRGFMPQCSANRIGHILLFSPVCHGPCEAHPTRHAL